MGIFGSIRLKMSNDKIVTTKIAGDILGYRDFALCKISSIKVNGPLCNKDVVRLVDVCKQYKKLTMIDLKETSGLLEIKDNTFHGCDCLQTIILPNSIIRIGESAFESCRSLTNIQLPDSLLTIGKSAFYGCSSLKKIHIPLNVKHIGGWAFVCDNLSIIEVDDNNKSFTAQNGILYSADGKNLIKYPTHTDNPDFSIPAKVERITDAAFWGSDVKRIVFPESIKTIGDNAFIYSQLENLDLPLGTCSIGKLAFSHCAELLSVKIPRSVNYIGERAFTECHKLTNVTVANGVTGIGDNAFANCHNLKEVNLPDSAYVRHENSD